MPQPDIPQALIAALAERDEKTRIERAARILWLGQHNSLSAMIAGRGEILQMLTEAPDCFVNGHYVAALTLAVAVIEQSLAEWLVSQGHCGHGASLDVMIRAARDKQLLPDDLLDQAARLRAIRNPFAHLKPERHEHRLPNRYQSAAEHPVTIMESDARDAIALMYQIFRRTLSNAVC